MKLALISVKSELILLLKPFDNENIIVVSGAHIGDHLHAHFGERFTGANPEVLRSLVAAGITGT